MKKFKRSAIHNLVITDIDDADLNKTKKEGLIVPKKILAISDIRPYEQVIVTKIDGDNWINRLKTFVIPGEDEGSVVACGSLAKFFNIGEITCLISHCFLDESEYDNYLANEIPIIDVGYDPTTNKNNLENPSINIEYFDKKIEHIDHDKLTIFVAKRKNINRIMLSSLLLNLVVNKTHPDCLQGSAELPHDVIEKVNVTRYQSVTVYNSSKGGSSDTYVVPMPPQVVMTTGAMAKFAQIGECVNVATFSVIKNEKVPTIGYCEENICKTISQEIRT